MHTETSRWIDLSFTGSRSAQINEYDAPVFAFENAHGPPEAIVTTENAFIGQVYLCETVASNYERGISIVAFREGFESLPSPLASMFLLELNKSLSNLPDYGFRKGIYSF